MAQWQERLRCGMTLAVVILAASASAAEMTLTADITEAQYGARPGDGKDDTAAIQKALDALVAAGHLVVPPGRFRVSMAKGLRITKKDIRVIVKGTIEARTEGLEAPACKHLFYVTGEGCAFIGEGGMLVGDGSTFHGGLDKQGLYPALIYFRAPAHGASIRGLRLRNPPGGHVVFFGATDCSMTGCVVEGGPEKVKDSNPVGPASRYYGVFFRGASGLRLHGNHFKRFKGRSQYQWVTSSSTNQNLHVSIIGNHFEGSFDHPIYCSGLRRSVVSNNITRNTYGTAIKLIGTDLVVVGNNIYNAPAGGIETRNGSRCIVANNLVDGFGHNAIEVSDYNKNNLPHTDNVIEGNILIAVKEGVAPVMSGIYISSAGECSRNKVTGNLILNAGRANVKLDKRSPGEAAITIAAGKPSDGISVTGNTIQGARGNGIYVRHARSSLITDNIIACGRKGVVDASGRGNVIERNVVRRLDPRRR